MTSDNIAIDTAYLLRVDGVHIPQERPSAKTVWLVYWPEAGIEISWPEGMTMAEAISNWTEKRR